MLGIEKNTLINALMKADAKIFTEDDINDLFYEIGKECSYNDDGEVEFELSRFYEKFKKEENEEESEKIDIPRSIKMVKLSDLSLRERILNYGPSIICCNCNCINQCTRKANCSQYVDAMNFYEKNKETRRE